MPAVARARELNDWLTGLKHGAVGLFGSFLVGALIAAVFALSANPPVWATAMPYIGALGGFAFGFVEGATRD